MTPEVENFNNNRGSNEQAICLLLYSIINQHLPEAENKIWHSHPVWFLDKNPIVGYSQQKAGIRLMFWSGASFNEEKLKPGTGNFKDASIFYKSVDQINKTDLQRWIALSKDIQWDYKNVAKRKGVLERLK